jgi:hypothetical protein
MSMSSISITPSGSSAATLATCPKREAEEGAEGDHPPALRMADQLAGVDVGDRALPKTAYPVRVRTPTHTPTSQKQANYPSMFAVVRSHPKLPLSCRGVRHRSTPEHMCGRHFHSWGSSGRRFKSCQPDQRTRMSTGFRRSPHRCHSPQYTNFYTSQPGGTAVVRRNPPLWRGDGEEPPLAGHTLKLVIATLLELES